MKRIEVQWNKQERLWESTPFDGDEEIDEPWQVAKDRIPHALEQMKKYYGIENVVKVKSY